MTPSVPSQPSLPSAYEPVPPPAGDPMLERDRTWVFGYGSLMWRPGFPYAEVRTAALEGFHRDMCLASIHYRGTAAAPGLVCGLMEGGRCIGRAYRLALADVNAALAYLDERELITDVYIPRHVPVTMDDGGRVVARVYVADTAHGQFAGHWSMADKIAGVVRGQGSEGRSLHYLQDLVRHLRELGIEDAHMADLLDRALLADSVSRERRGS